ncbi:D-arabitol-phosphate dehydrogenase [Polystyrenella longa]|uniref:D-arabitol-phosphate dehydrogenase n=1 Tax=Polystyrenella longa TaxID=2528007 RepID=A0A518CRC4_9PLAN|nr:zinc-binding dehydrogenase [Polystyrenella longa]QDU81786.1 D-arabitol-phosphate dehydrogenase [Polystyrenella longa]
MFAGHISAPNKIELVEVEEPKLSNQRGEILFQPECACLCGSDMPFFTMSGEVDTPVVGHSLHEMIGSVIDTNGSKFKPGDRVLAVPVYQVGFFERYVLSEERAIPLADNIAEDIAMMAQPLGTVLYALRKLPNMLGKTVAIVGQGPIGQLFTLALRNLGASRIIAIDPLAARLEVSRKSGATHFICNGDADPVEEVTRITNGAMVDVVIEAVGHQYQQLNLCAKLVKKFGMLVYFGVPAQTIENVGWGEVFRKNLTVVTSVEPDFSLDFPLAMQWISEGRVDVSHLLTHRYPLSDIQKAYEHFRDKTDGSIKVLIEFPSWKHKTL